MGENPSAYQTRLATPLEPNRVFRPGKKGIWHLRAHQEYGVVWSECGLRVLAKDCQSPSNPIYIRDLCGTCSRKAKEEIGRERRSDQEEAS